MAIVTLAVAIDVGDIPGRDVAAYAEDLVRRGVHHGDAAVIAIDYHPDPDVLFFDEAAGRSRLPHLVALADGSWEADDDWCPQCHASGLRRRHPKCRAR